MKKLIILSLITLNLFSQENCPEVRSQICTMIYNPVCATFIDNRMETKSSPCTACSDKNIISYKMEPCNKNELIQTKK